MATQNPLIRFFYCGLKVKKVKNVRLEYRINDPSRGKWGNVDMIMDFRAMLFVF